MFDDDEITINVRFFWTNGTSNIDRADFILTNKNFHGDKYKIHEVVYCFTNDNIEIRLSSHNSFGNQSSISNQHLGGMQLDIGDERRFWFRISKQSLFCRRPYCEKPGTTGSPDDKDGSIIIGT